MFSYCTCCKLYRENFNPLHRINIYREMKMPKNKKERTNTSHLVNKGAGSRQQGWHSGESTRLPPMWPRFNSRSRWRMWVEFVVDSCPCEGFSPGTPVFLLPQKPTFPNSNLTWKQWMEEPQPWNPLKFPIPITNSQFPIIINGFTFKLKPQNKT